MQHYKRFNFMIGVSLILSMSLITKSKAEERPNVVLINIDDLGYGDIGPYGCKDIPTPHLDRLADEGVKFSASYIVNPPCCPSRCCLMTGQYVQRFGKYGMSRGLPIPEDRPTLAKFLSDNGYVTGQIGKWDIGTKSQGPLNVGFNQVSKTPPKKQYSEEEIAKLEPTIRKAIKGRNGASKYFCINKEGETVWLTDHDGDAMVDFIKRQKKKPFFLYWSPEAVHSINIETPDRLKNRTTAKGKRRPLAGAIVSVDDQIGKLLDILDELKLRKNTLVIFASDNGANVGEGGTSTPYRGGKGQGTQQEGWVRVPTIFSMPGLIPEGKEYHGMIANFDFYSTIAALTCQTIPDHCDGVNLIPYIRGEKKETSHEYLFWLNNQPDDAPRRHLVAVRWKDWRLYKMLEEDPWQLFDLKKDPTEENNVAQHHPEIVKQLSDKHAEWKKTLAPLAKIPKNQDKQIIIPKGHGWAFKEKKKPTEN